MHTCFPSSFTAEILRDLASRESDVTIELAGRRMSTAISIELTTEASQTFLVDIAIDSDAPLESVTGLFSTPNRYALLAIINGWAHRIVVVGSEISHSLVDIGGHITSTKCANDAGVLILASFWHIAAIDAGGIRWRTERLAAEGIHLENVTESHLWGIVDPETNAQDFVLDLHSGDVRLG